MRGVEDIAQLRDSSEDALVKVAGDGVAVLLKNRGSGFDNGGLLSGQGRGGLGVEGGGVANGAGGGKGGGPKQHGELSWDTPKNVLVVWGCRVSGVQCRFIV